MWSEGGADLTGDKLEKSKQLKRQKSDANFKLWEVNTARDQRKMDLREQIVDLQHEIHQEKRGQEFINSGHFDEPNILAHLRMKDRVDTDGNKTLLIEEAQSDWHQTGADVGYKGGSEAISEATRKVNEANIASNKAEQEMADYFKRNGLDMESEVFDTDLYLNLLETDEASKIMDGQADRMSNVEAANRNLVDVEKAARTGVPDAPFKTDDKSSWYNLAMKRGLIEAAEGDYDKLAITTGRQQADRYDLSKQINEVRLGGNERDGFTVSAFDKNNTPVIMESIESLDELPNLIGKDAAKSLVDQPLSKGSGLDEYDEKRFRFLQNKVDSYPGDAYSGDIEELDALKLKKQAAEASGNGPSVKILAGQDLSVGGEGMKQFYDRTLPNALGKLVKQDGVKVGQTELNRDVFTMQEVAEIERLQDLVDRDYASSIDREDLANYLAREKPYGDTVHSIDITPEMRERVKKGLPLFAQGGLAVGGGALFAPKDLQAAEYNEAPVIEEQSFGDMVNEYGQINRNLKALDDQRFARLMDEEKKLRAMGSASFGKVSPELAAYRRSQLIPSVGTLAQGAVRDTAKGLDYLSPVNLTRLLLDPADEGLSRFMSPPISNTMSEAAKVVTQPMLFDEDDPYSKKRKKNTMDIGGMLFSPL